ncbi:MAG: hypothetical protein ACLRVT_10345 [Oscillospiraceae bacterium]
MMPGKQQSYSYSVPPLPGELDGLGVMFFAKRTCRFRAIDAQASQLGIPKLLNLPGMDRVHAGLSLCRHQLQAPQMSPSSVPHHGAEVPALDTPLPAAAAAWRSDWHGDKRWEPENCSTIINHRFLHI